MSMHELRAAQRQVWANKQRQGFNTTDVVLELCLLQAEVSEFFDAWRRQRPDAGEELADVAIYLLGLAEMIGVDLAAEVAYKVAKNAARRYELYDGVLTKVAAAAGWRACACDRSRPDHVDMPPDPAGGDGCGMAWRPRGGEIEERHVTEITATDTDFEVRPGGHLRQDVPTGPGLPNHQHSGQGEPPW